METNRLRIVWIIAFILFAGVSCWATTESLHMLLSSWPIIFCWVVSIGFFIIASFGTKLIVDSLNQSIYLEKRGTYLFGGIVITLIFWLVCSMPTNTHTFFYRTVIEKEVDLDINTTQNYLAQIRDNTKNEYKIQQQLNKLDADAESKLGELEAEIKNDVNPGFGPNAKNILQEFASMFNVAEIKPLSLGSGATSTQGREKLCREYRKKIYTLKEARKEAIVMSMTKPEQGMKDAKVNYQNLQIVKDAISSKDYDLNDADDINEVKSKLNTGYNTVNVNKLFVDFNTPEDEERYTSSNLVTRIDRLTSVFDTWSDFFAGRFSGQGFAFWIIISILVDVAAFIFFDMAFKKREF